MPFTLCHAAGDMFMRTPRRVAVIDFAANHGDIYTVSESQKDHAAVHRHPDMDSYAAGEIIIGWKRDLFEQLGDGHRHQVMRGGKLGPLRRAGRLVPTRLRRARRGPSRDVAWIPLAKRDSGREVIVASHHAIAKSDTTHRWRRPLRAQGFAGVAKELNRALKLYPGAALILTGDMNTKGRIAFAIAGIREARTPATFGRLRYDRIFRLRAGVSGIKRAVTQGDHKALIATVSLQGATR